MGQRHMMRLVLLVLTIALLTGCGDKKGGGCAPDSPECSPGSPSEQPGQGSEADIPTPSPSIPGDLEIAPVVQPDTSQFNQLQVGDSLIPLGCSKVSVTTSPAAPQIVAEAPSKSPNVIIYGSAQCLRCTQAKSFLNSLGIPFTEYDVKSDRSKGDEMRAKASKQNKRIGLLPVIEVDGVIYTDLAPFENAIRQYSIPS